MTCFRTQDGKTVRQWCLANKVPYASVWESLDRGLSVIDACKRGIERRGKKNNSKYFYNGKTISDMFGNNSSSYQKFIRRIYKGMTISESLKGLV